MKQPYKASEIAAFLGAALQGPDITVECPATLDSAAPNRVVFLKMNDPELLKKITAHKEVLAILPEGMKAEGISIIHSANPRLAFARVLEKYFKKPKASELIAKTAIIDPTATLGTNVRIGNYSVIGAGAVIGDNTEIRHHVVIAPGVKIGRDCLIKSGAILGEEGYGFEKDEAGIQQRLHHIGSVSIGDRVEVGSLTCIACGTVDDTMIGDDTKIDDHVFIAHNVKVGKNCMIIAASEVSGSVKIGDNVWMAPSVTVINGVEIGANALLGIGAVITKPVEPKAVMGGARATFLRYADQSKS